MPAAFTKGTQEWGLEEAEGAKKSISKIYIIIGRRMAPILVCCSRTDSEAAAPGGGIGGRLLFNSKDPPWGGWVGGSGPLDPGGGSQAGGLGWHEPRKFWGMSSDDPIFWGVPPGGPVPG